jgi:hypothetical protein
MTTEIRNQLDALLGKEFNYKGKIIIIERYKEVGGTNTVVFTPKPLNFLNSEIPEFLEDLYDPSYKAKNEAQVFVPKKELVTFEPTAENKVIKATLMETLEKVKNDPTYIPQAKSVCEVVGSLIDIQKNEIQMLGIINKFK